MEDYKTEQELDERYKLYAQPALLHWYCVKRNTVPSLAKLSLMKEMCAIETTENCNSDVVVKEDSREG